MVLCVTTAWSYAVNASDEGCYPSATSPRGGTLPANASVLIAGRSDDVTDADVTELDAAPNGFTLWKDDAPVDLAFWARPDGFVEAHPLTPLEVGEEYQITTGRAGCAKTCTSFIAGDNAPMPTSPGELRVVESVVQGDGNRFELEAYVKFEFVPDKKLVPFLHVARITLDGVLAEGNEVGDRYRWTGRREFAISRRCADTPRDLVKVEAVVELPGRVELRSAPQYVFVHCGLPWRRLDHETALTSAFGRTRTCSHFPGDGGPVDGHGAPYEVEGAVPTLVLDPDGPEPGPEPPVDHGHVPALTGCSVGQRRSRQGSSLPAGALLALALVGLGRRRRSKSR